MAIPPLEDVAGVYLQALRDGRAPTRAVEAAFQTTRSTAGRWVWMARKTGHLAPATATDIASRVSRATNPKLLAVAAALGVAPDTLAAAVIEHANGDIRLSTGAVNDP